MPQFLKVKEYAENNNTICVKLSGSIEMQISKMENEEDDIEHTISGQEWYIIPMFLPYNPYWISQVRKCKREPL